METDTDLGIDQMLPGKDGKRPEKKYPIKLIIILLILIAAAILGLWNLFSDSSKQDSVDKAVIDACVERFKNYEYLAHLKEDAELCKKTDDAEACTYRLYLLQAIKHEDKGYCDRIDESPVAGICRNILDNQIETCSNFPMKHERIACRAMISGNSELCQTIDDPIEKGDCEEASVYMLAIKKGDINICNNLVDNEENAFCRGLIKEDPDIYLDQVRENCLSGPPPSSLLSQNR